MGARSAARRSCDPAMRSRSGPPSSPSSSSRERMLQPVSVGLKFGFLIVLYLFLFWVAASTLFDLRRGFGGRREGGAAVGEATRIHQTGDPPAAREADCEPRRVVDQAEGHEAGVAYDLMDPVTLGRGSVELKLEDPF